jgi:hypothetical protein
MAWKYVILRTGNREVPIIFPESLVHAGVAEAMKSYFAAVAVTMSSGMLSEESVGKLVADIGVVAAGEVAIDIGSASGGSETLGVQSRPTDSKWLQAYPYHHGLSDIEPDADQLPASPVRGRWTCELCSRPINTDGKRAHRHVKVDSGWVHQTCYRQWKMGKLRPSCHVDEHMREVK